MFRLYSAASSDYYAVMSVTGCSPSRMFVVIGLLVCAAAARADTFRVATYNLENYIDQPTQSRTAIKSAEARAKIRESIRAANPDVIGLQEVGAVSALEELRASLKSDGLDFPYWEHVSGFDTNIHVAVLSRFPIIARRPHTNDNFLLSGRRFRVSRGFAEVDIRVNSRYAFTFLTAHLKSKRPVPEADEVQERLEEAKILRGIVEADLAANPRMNLVLAGDFNDTKDSASTKAVIGRGAFKLADSRPAERNGDDARNPVRYFEPRTVTWTHYYGKEDTYSRIDYILISPGMAREWISKETYIPTVANWGIGSDHRPIVATFEAEEK